MTQTSDLCSRCEANVDWANLPDWKNWRSKTASSTRCPNKPGTKVVRNFPGKSRAELMNSSCQACQLVGRLVNPGSGSPDDQFLNICLEAYGPGDDCSDEFPSVKLGVRSPATGSTELIGDEHDYTRLLMAYKSTGDRNAAFRELNPCRVDFELFKTKLTECLEDHEECQPTKPEVAGLRLINVHTGEVISVEEVKALKDCKYVALSYVWGTESPQNPQKGFQPVVQDAITVTKELGWEYLWVDQYCINQEEESLEKISMIQQMDKVYSNACCTIVVASGDSAGDRLPGVGGKPRYQCRTAIGETRLIEISNIGSDTIKSSKWATRGWTYQEGFLSKRRLIFLENEVVLLCNKEFTMETQRYQHETGEYRWMTPYTDRSARSNLYSNIWPHIMAYSERDLSNDCDSLNAFLGILKHYEGLVEEYENGPVSHLWGIPLKLLEDFEEGQLYVGLIWKHKSIARRRNNLPSWSWSGWKGPILGFAMSTVGLRLQTPPPEDNDQNGNRVVRISIPNGNTTTDLLSLVRGRQLGQIHDSGSKELLITSFILPLRLRQVNTYPTIQEKLDLWRTASYWSQKPPRVFATFDFGPDVFFGYPIYFDRDDELESCTDGLILPCSGKFYNSTFYYYYIVIVLRSRGDGKYERAGIGGFMFNADLGNFHELGDVTDIRNTGNIFMDGQDQILKNSDVNPVKESTTNHFFLKDLEWKTVRLV